MKNDIILDNISSDYCLKSIFTYLDYNCALKLIKYNKKFQNKLNIKIDNYRIFSSYKYIKRKIIRKLKYIYNKYEQYQRIALFSIITLVPLTYILTFSSILYFEGSFNGNNLKDNFNIKYLNTINKINKSLYILEAHILTSFFIIICFIFNNYYFDIPQLKKIKYTVLLLINSVYYFYELLVIWKLYLSYKIKKNKILWFMVCDYILICIILLYIIFMIYITYRFYKFSGSSVQMINKTILKKYKNITINDFELPNNFHEMNKQNKKIFILNNAYKFQYKHSERHIDLINLINEYRVKNNLDKLLYNEEEKISEFLIKESAEVMLCGYKNFFILSNRKYLFKYNIDGFKKNFNKRDSDILGIVLNRNVNKISLIDIDNFEYILIYDSMDDSRINLIEAKNSIPNELDKDMYEEKIEDFYYEE